MTEHLNLTKDEKSTLSGDKPFHTSVTRCQEYEDPTVHEQRRLKILYGCLLVTDTVLISKKLVQSVSINPNIIQNKSTIDNQGKIKSDGKKANTKFII